jgi:hypothetical protein
MSWDKELLLKDLCARLPYGVKVQVDSKHWCDFNSRIPSEITFDNSYRLLFLGTKLGYVKPYLFPLSSMTTEQRYELHDLIHNLNVLAINGEIGDWIVSSSEIDWYNKNHFDYRGLIPKGLALDATGKNIY